ncbi:hypothetical protein F442_16082 [Phytophthora nicotianae P10297]|uniref:Uncharacterized protein n=2 Tax=Phytophthora nicotianae TaxID=4792 RepID=W2YLQ3_PHYNI|nr:hypothetical protein L917_21544 [Phytophthora nicotianae]ETP35846.1 hypothetical protein F442_16082 [Phytophthora nicotianae P10297]
MHRKTSEITAYYACKESKVPEVLWHVRYPGSSLKARVKPAFKNKDEFKTVVKLRLNWRNDNPTPFVSLLEGKDNALKWAEI